jgi:uncharacterized protein YjbI with pentapeptide repeats
LGDRATDEAMVRLALGNSAQIVLFALGGLIALVGVGLSLSRHGLELETAQTDRDKEDRRIHELGQQRHIDAERELRARFISAISLLSDAEKGTTKEAGVYALAALADDWHAFGRTDERQVCIDVLCSYLRSRWEPDGVDADRERRIRAAAFDAIGNHLRIDSLRPRWSGARFNLRGALIDFDTNFNRIDTSDTMIDFSEATFSGGTIDVENSHFAGALIFRRALLQGSSLRFRGSTFAGGLLNFEDAKLSAGTVNFSGASFQGTNVLFLGAEFSGSSLNFLSAKLAAGRVAFGGATFSAGSVLFARAKFRGADVEFDDATFSGSRVMFRGATFSSGDISFTGARLGSRKPDFAGAKFEGTVGGEGEPFRGLEGAGSENTVMI